MIAGDYINRFDCGFARWCYFNDNSNDDPASGNLGTYNDALWVSLDDSGAFKVAQGTYIHLINGFRSISMSYVDLGPSSTGITFDILFGENSGDFVMRPFVNGVISWGAPTATSGDRFPPKNWG